MCSVWIGEAPHVRTRGLLPYGTNRQLQTVACSLHSTPLSQRCWAMKGTCENTLRNKYRDVRGGVILHRSSALTEEHRTTGEGHSVKCQNESVSASSPHKTIKNNLHSMDTLIQCNWSVSVQVLASFNRSAMMLSVRLLSHCHNKIHQFHSLSYNLPLSFAELLLPSFWPSYLSSVEKLFIPVPVNRLK